MILSVGNGQAWRDLYANYAVPGTTDVVANDQPDPRVQGSLTCWLRGSAVTMPPGANATADWLKAPGALRGYDEVVVSHLGADEAAWWETVLGAVGCNDADTASRVLLFVAGNPTSSPHTGRLLAAAAANPKVLLGVEGYHQGSLYTTYDAIRADERAWLATLTGRGYPMGRVAYGASASDAPWYVDSNPAYCSASTLARDADEDAVFDWMSAGTPHLFVWVPYSTPRSRWMAGDALYRGLRRRYQIAP